MGMLRCLVLLCLSCLAACQTKSSSVVPQPFQSLPPPPTYTEGGFKNPNTATGGYTYTQGTVMNISWWTIHPTVNLFLIYGQNYDNPYWLASGTSQKWHLWTVEDHGHNEHPFSLRATNPQGSQTEQTVGGFFTGQFWIKLAPSASLTSSSVQATNTGSQTHLTATSLQSSTTKTKSSHQTSGAAANNDSSNSTAVGVGAGVGVGVGVLVIVAGVLIWWFVRRRGKDRRSQQPLPGHDYVGSPPPLSHTGSSTHWNQNARPYYAPLPMEMQQHPGGLSRGASIKPWQPGELSPERESVYEAPGNVEPRELPGDSSITPKPPAQYG